MPVSGSVTSGPEPSRAVVTTEDGELDGTWLEGVTRHHGVLVVVVAVVGAGVVSGAAPQPATRPIVRMAVGITYVLLTARGYRVPHATGFCLPALRVWNGNVHRDLTNAQAPAVLP